VCVCVCEVWKSGRSSRLLLLDFDATTRSSADGWKQLNTLAHYNIPNDSTFVVVNRRVAEASPDGDSPVTRTVNGTKTTAVILSNSVPTYWSICVFLSVNFKCCKVPATG